MELTISLSVLTEHRAHVRLGLKRIWMGNSGSSSNVNVPRHVSFAGVDLEELAKTTHCKLLDMNLLFSLIR